MLSPLVAVCFCVVLVLGNVGEWAELIGGTVSGTVISTPESLANATGDGDSKSPAHVVHFLRPNRTDEILQAGFLNRLDVV